METGPSRVYADAVWSMRRHMGPVDTFKGVDVGGGNQDAFGLAMVFIR